MMDHTESIEVVFDPTKVTYEKLLDFFWKEHTPTGGSYSRQYMNAVRSV